MALACVALTAVPAGLALAGYQSGPYSGSTEQGEEIRFRAGELQIKRLSTVVFADCRNGKRQRIAVDSGRTMIDDDRFDLELTGTTDLTVEVTGRIQGAEAAGRVEASVRPSGTLCTADVRWRADRL